MNTPKSYLPWANALPLTLFVCFFTHACNPPEPATTLTVALDSEIAEAFRPLLKTPDAFGGYTVAIVEGPAKSIYTRISRDGFSPDAIMTLDREDFVLNVMQEFVDEPHLVAQSGDRQVVFASLRGSAKGEGIRNLLGFLEGAEAAARIKEAGFEPLPPPGKPDPLQSIGKETIPQPLPGTPIGQSAGYR